MENKDKPAFPEPYINDPNLALSIMPGLTKREYFAVMAMHGWIACQHEGFSGQPDDIAARAINCADELLKMLEQ